MRRISGAAAAWAAVLMLLGLAGPAAGQATGEGDGAGGVGDLLAELRAKAALTDEDRGKLRTWIDERMTALSSPTTSVADQAAADLRGAMSGGSQGYREALIALLSDAVRQKLAGASLTAAARMIALLAAANEPVTQPVLIEALNDERAAVRVGAAVGLRTLRAKLAVVGGDAVTNVFAALREAGKKETSAPALRAIYEALNYADTVPPIPNPPDPRANVAALLDILESRAAAYASGNPKAEAAELAGVRAAGALRNRMTDEEKNRYIAVLGELLRYGVQRYNAGLYNVKDRTSSPHLVELRNSIELMILEIETQLAELLSVPRGEQRPSIVSAMKELVSEGERINLKIQMNMWADLIEKAIGKRYHMDEAGEQAADGGGD